MFPIRFLARIVSYWNKYSMLKSEKSIRSIFRKVQNDWHSYNTHICTCRQTYAHAQTCKHTHGAHTYTCIHKQCQLARCGMVCVAPWSVQSAGRNSLKAKTNTNAPPRRPKKGNSVKTNLARQSLALKSLAVTGEKFGYFGHYLSYMKY